MINLAAVWFLSRGLHVLLVGLIAAWLAFTANLFATQTAFAANPPPVQHFYVPVPEDQVFAALKAIYPSNFTCPAFGENVANPIITYISISVISDNTILYYDHWEDGFEIDVTHPQQPTTQIWGDGNPANGAPPGNASDLIKVDSVIVLNNPVNSTTLQSVIDFDGGDRISSSNMIAMTRAAWATGSSTLLADAVEVYDTNSWGINFEAPVGQNVNYNSLFEYTGLHIMAAQNGTQLSIDLDGNGTAELTPVINQGQSYHVNGGVNVGAKVTASAPVQVVMVTGDVCDNYESRWFVLFPTERWSSSYYNPVGTPAGDGTTVFVYNPSASPLAVQWESVSGAQPAINVAPRSVGYMVVPDNAGSHFYTADNSPFMALAAVDSDGPSTANARADWGFTLVPERMLTPQIMVGWGAGRNPFSNVKPSENGSPVWVTPALLNGIAGPVNICVDYDGDSIGPLTDGYGIHYDQQLTLNQFQAARVLDPDGDQTGMMLYVCNMPLSDLLRVKLAAAWGQQPGLASADEPGLDLGTTAPPAASFAVGKAADLVVDGDNDGKADPGDTLLYTILIRNTARIPIDNVILIDEVPQHTSYVLNTTQFNNNGTLAPLPDQAAGTPFPLDEGGTNLGTLPVRGLFTVTFRALIDNPLPLSVTRVHNVAIVRALDEEKQAEVETPIDFDPAIAIEKATNGVDADTPTGPILHVGDPVIWTYTVRNTGAVPLANIMVTDNIAGVTPVYVSGDANNDAILDLAEVWTYQATGVATLGQYANIGVVRGTGPEGDQVTAQDPSHYLGLQAAIHLVKAASANVVTAGQTVVYTYTVTNIGNDPLHQVTLVDDKCSPVTFIGGDANGDTVLDLTETWFYRCTAVITQTTTNTATVTGRDSFNNLVTDNDQATVIVPNLYFPIIIGPAPTPCPPPTGCPIPGLDYPKGMAVHQGRNLLYITSRDTDRLLVVDPQSNQVVAQAATGDEPWAVVINEGTGRVYVSNYASGDVWVYDVATLNVLAKITVGANPALMEILPGLDTVFVVVRQNSRVAILQGLTKIQDISAGGSGPFGIAADTVNNRIFVANRDSGHLALVYRENNVWQVQSKALAAAGSTPFELAYNAANDKLYLVYANAASNWFVDIWRPHAASPWTLEKTIPVGNGGGIQSPDVGGAGLAINPTTGHVFNLNTAAGTMSVISGSSDKVIATVPTGADPFPIAINPVTNVVFIGLRNSDALVKIEDVFGE